MIRVRMILIVKRGMIVGGRGFLRRNKFLIKSIKSYTIFSGICSIPAAINCYHLENRSNTVALVFWHTLCINNYALSLLSFLLKKPVSFFESGFFLFL